MSQQADELQKKAAALATGPGYQDWREFIGAFRLYVADLKDRCVQAPTDRFQVSQGHAQQGVSLLNLLENAVKEQDEKAKKREKLTTHRP